MHLFINSLAASAGGGLTYIRNVIPYLAAVPDLRFTVALSSGLRQEFAESKQIEFLELQISPAKRLTSASDHLSLVVSTAVIASPMQRQASSNWPSSAWALAKYDSHTSSHAVDPCDGYAVIANVILRTASEALPVRTN